MKPKSDVKKADISAETLQRSQQMNSSAVEYSIKTSTVSRECISKPILKAMFLMEKSDSKDFCLSIETKAAAVQAVKEIQVDLKSEFAEKINEKSDFDGDLGESKFLGILGKCQIEGCDVHALNSAFEIIDHFELDKEIDGHFKKARKYLNDLNDSMQMLLVFSEYFIVLNVNGSYHMAQAED